MPIKPEDKKWIDEASCEELLHRWRFSPPATDSIFNTGDRIFEGETGEYYSEKLTQRKNEEPDGGVAVSKKVGW